MIQFDDDILKWSLAGIGAALVSGVAALWSTFKVIFKNESNCQKELALFKGILMVQMAYENRKDVVIAYEKAMEGNAEHLVEDLKMALTSGRRGHKRKQDE